jgi:predicted GTPase
MKIKKKKMRESNNNDENFKKHKELKQEIEERMKELKEKWSKINICLVGYSGAGKSSFVRTLLSIQKDKIINKIQIARKGTIEQITKSLLKYSFCDFLDFYDTKV